MAGVDVSGSVSLLGTVVTAVASVGVAVLTLDAGIQAFKWCQNALGFGSVEAANMWADIEDLSAEVEGDGEEDFADTVTQEQLAEAAD